MTSPQTHRPWLTAGIVLLAVAAPDESPSALHEDETRALRLGPGRDRGMKRGDGLPPTAGIGDLERDVAVPPLLRRHRGAIAPLGKDCAHLPGFSL